MIVMMVPDWSFNNVSAFFVIEINAFFLITQNIYFAGREKEKAIQFARDKERCPIHLLPTCL